MDKKEFKSHELITGQWVETPSLNRLKARDVSEPHPFNWLSSHADILTCYKDGKPYFKDLVRENGFLQKIDDYYLWTDDNSQKIKLQFKVSGKDTLLIYEYQFETNTPFIYSLSKTPMPTPCDFDYYPGKELRSGRSKCYNSFYFKGKYEVKEIATNKESLVEIFSDFKISGLPGVGKYNLHTYGSPLMLEFYEADTMRSNPIRMGNKQYPRIRAKNKQYLVLDPQENGFDLHKTDFSGKSSTTERRFQVLDKVYEFRRK